MNTGTQQGDTMHIISNATKQQFSKSILVSIPILVAVTLFFLTMVPLMVVAQGGGEYVATHQILLLIDNSGSVLDGTGAAADEPTDPDNKRLRFAVFLSQYIRTFSGTTEVGVISFAGNATTVVPLTPVADWTLADLHAIETFSQTHQSKTDFKTALAAAHNQFLETGACNNQSQCSIVLFTDGIVYQTDEKVVNAEIQSIHADNIQILPVILSANINEPGLSMEDKTEITDKLQETIGNWRETITGTPIITDVNSANLPRLYHKILSPLGLNGPLDALKSMTTDKDKTVKIPLPVTPYQQLQHIRLFGDRPITTTQWNVPPNLSSGIDNYWFNFSGDILTATVNAPPLTTIFYSVDNSQDKIYLNAQINPNRQIVGEPISLIAWLVGGSTIITDSHKFSVTAWADNANHYELEPQTDGYFETTIATTDWITGSHLITLMSVSRTEPDFNITPLTKTLYIDVAPKLKDIDAKFLPSTSITAPVLITVTVENALPATIPRLRVILPRIEAIPLNTTWIAGVFTGSVTALPGEEIRLQAILPVGKTVAGLPYAEQRLTRDILADELSFQAFIPHKISTEEPLVMKAVVLRGRQVISDGNIRVQAILTPENVPYTLTRTSDGYYATRIMPPITTGVHTVTITSTSQAFQQQQQLEVVKIPGLRMRVARTTISSPVNITVTVDNYTTIDGRYTPTLSMANGQTIPLKSTANSGVFVATMPNSTLPKAGTTIRAVLVSGITLDGIDFPGRVSEKQVCPSTPPQKKLQWQWLIIIAIALLAVSLLAGLLMVGIQKYLIKNVVATKEIEKYAKEMSERDINRKTTEEAEDFAKQAWEVIE